MEVLTVDKLLNAAELDHVVKQSLKNPISYKLVKSEVRKASEGLTGYLGDHLKLVLYVQVEETEHKIYLFMKLVPTDHEAKAQFINENNFFVKEAFVLNFLEKITTPDSNPWCSTTYLKNDKLVVMPDLTIDGYSTRPVDQAFDIQHILVASDALARFHAVFTNYVAKRSLNEGNSYNANDEFDAILTETVYIDNPWTRTGAQVHKNFLKEYSTQYNDIEIDLFPLYQKAFNTLHYYEETYNVLVHKDLWTSNIMFKYDNGIPTNAILIDFQMVKYAPPAFDIMIMLYMTTTRSFREQNEKKVLNKYFTAYMENIDENSTKMLLDINYNWTEFCKWCEKARMMGMVVALLICQFALINPKHAEKLFNNKSTYTKVMNEDRAKPMIEYAKDNDNYRTKMLELIEEFIETYILSKQLHE